jgi:hypothetical protein
LIGLAKNEWASMLHYYLVAKLPPSLVLLAIIVVMKSSVVDRDNNYYCHYDISMNCRLRNYAGARYIFIRPAIRQQDRH